MGIQDLFGSNPKLPTTNKTRTFSESKGMSNAGRKKLTKIDEHHHDKKKHSLKDNIYFQSPDKNAARSQHGHHNAHNQHHNHNNGHMNNVHVNHQQGQTPTNRHLRGHNHSHSY